MNVKLLTALVIMVMALMGAGALALASSEDSDAADVYLPDYPMEVGKYYDIPIKDIWSQTNSNNTFKYGSGGTLPTGVSLVSTKGSFPSYSEYRIRGTPTSTGSYTYYAEMGPYPNTDKEYSKFVVTPATFTVTYHAGIGLVNGVANWSEQIYQNSYASLPAATYSSGAYSFVGWSTSSSGSSTISSLKVTANTDLYAVYSQNSTTISPYSATVTQGQSFSNTFAVTPSNATISITSNGGLSGLSVSSGKILSGTVNANPGTYYVVLSCSASGYKVSTTTVAITVPIVITPPIEYYLNVGNTFNYTPATDPANTTVTLTKVTKDGVTITNSGLSVVGRTVTGSFSSPGTYAVTVSCNASGYVGVSKVVYIYVSAAPVTSDPPSISSLIVTERVNEPRTYDLIASGVSNAVNMEFFVNGTLFSTSSQTAIYQVPGAGVYVFKCDAVGGDGTRASATTTVVCTEEYYRDMAWVGIDYKFVKEISGSDPTVSVSGPFSYAFQTVSGSRYLTISGTPTSSDVGEEYTVQIGSDSYKIKVYAKEDLAPVSEFEMSIIDYTVTVSFIGQYASKVLWNYGDGVWVDSTSHVYSSVGYYTVSCKAVNNVAERVSWQLAEVGIVERTFLSLDDLTDYIGYVGESIIIQIDKELTDVLSISGSAADFLSVNVDTIFGSTNNAGDYELTITLTHGDSTYSSGMIAVVIQEHDRDSSPWLSSEVLLVLFAVLIILFVAYAASGKRKNGGRGSGGKRR